MKKRIMNLIGLIGCLMILAAPSYQNSNSYPVIAGGVYFPPNATTAVGRYVTSSDLTLISHTAAPVNPWPIKVLLDGTIPGSALTVDQNYNYIQVDNVTGDEIYFWVNDDNSTHMFRLQHGDVLKLDNTKHGIGTVHFSGSGTGNMTVIEFD